MSGVGTAEPPEFSGGVAQGLEFRSMFLHGRIVFVLTVRSYIHLCGIGILRYRDKWCPGFIPNGPAGLALRQPLLFVQRRCFCI